MQLGKLELYAYYYVYGYDWWISLFAKTFED